MIGEGSTLVIWNPSAGSSPGGTAVRERLESLPQVSLRETNSRRESIRAARDGARDFDLIVAAGGDGTINAVVNGLARTGEPPPLGILPLGTGNDFARTLAIPAEPDQALQILLGSVDASAIDLMRIAADEPPDFAVNMVTAGNTGRYLRHMSAEIKARWGPLCYLRGVIDVVRDLQAYRVEIGCDDQPPEEFQALNVFVANGAYSGGGLAVSPEAQPDDGHLDLVVVLDGDAGDLAGLTSRYLVSDYLDHELIVFRRARKIVLRSDPAIPLTADGDEIGFGPLTVTAAPGALRAVLPRATDEP